ncbi:oligosaccharide flippase family protein [Parabacteroides gordonii]|jgi:O-antigen/teichoic acid export membrane protein|uniref:oligosaccharide flippase family protein n=1 Tax=Parabacteroides gordonii TaxID=574930 RepID=UPI00241F0146|nr:oligosaccharide flippase family protein [Parabacteroides gordonii]
MRLIKNVLFNGSVQVSSILINLILLPYLTRILGEEALGINSFGLSITSYFALAGNLGIVLYGAKSLAEHRDHPEELQKKFSQCITYQFFFNLLAISLYNIWVCVIQQATPVYFLFNIVLLTTMTDLSWVYTGFERFDLIATRNILIKIIGTLLIFIFVKNTNDLPAYIIIQQGILFISNIIYWTSLPGIGLKIRFCGIGYSLKSIFKPAIYLFVPSIFTTVYMSLNNIMLGYMSDINAVAIYDYPNKLARILITMISVLGITMMPRLAYLSQKKTQDEYLKKMTQMIYASMIISIPAMFLLILTSPTLCMFIFGKGFNGSEIVLSIVAPTIVYSGLGLYNIFITQNKIRQLTWGVFCGTVINILLNLLLIPHFSFKGAAYSTLITETVVHLLLLFYLRKVLNIKEFIIIFISVFSISFFIYLILWKTFIINTFYDMIIVGVIYLLSYSILTLLFQRQRIKKIFF